VLTAKNTKHITSITGVATLPTLQVKQYSLKNTCQKGLLGKRKEKYNLEKI